MVSSTSKSVSFFLRTIKLNSSVFNFKSTTSILANSKLNSRSISTSKKNLLELKSPKRNLAQASSNQTIIPPPQFDGQPKSYSPKIEQLVNEIAKLNLIEVSDLNELLRKKLNIKDVPVSYAAMPVGGASQAAPAAKAEEAEPEAPKATKSSFRLKILKYDESKKVALIKEIKSLGENMNLVQAKKFIESVPQIFKDNIGKDEVEKIKAQLEKAGAVCEVE